MKEKSSRNECFSWHYPSVLILSLDVEYESRRKSAKIVKVSEIEKCILTWDSMGEQLVLCQSEKWSKVKLYWTLSFCFDLIFQRRIRIRKKISLNLKDSWNRKTLFNMGLYGRVTLICQSEKWWKAILFWTFSFCSDLTFRRRIRIRNKKLKKL